MFKCEFVINAVSVLIFCSIIIIILLSIQTMHSASDETGGAPPLGGGAVISAAGSVHENPPQVPEVQRDPSGSQRYPHSTTGPHLLPSSEWTRNWYKLLYSIHLRGMEFCSTLEVWQRERQGELYKNRHQLK